jgi:hypothetical protein
MRRIIYNIKCTYAYVTHTHRDRQTHTRTKKSISQTQIPSHSPQLCTLSHPAKRQLRIHTCMHKLKTSHKHKNPASLSPQLCTLSHSAKRHYVYTHTSTKEKTFHTQAVGSNCARLAIRRGDTTHTHTHTHTCTS